MNRPFLRLTTLFMPAIFLAAASGVDASTSPAPDPAALARAERLVREVYATQYALADPAHRRALARTLLRAASDSAEDLPNRYVLLRESRDLALQSGDIPTTLRAIHRLCDSFSEDRLRMSLSSLVKASEASPEPALHDSIAPAALRCAYDAVLKDDYLLARRFATLADDSSLKAKNVPLRQQVLASSAEIGALAQRFDRVVEARKSLADSLDDPEAREVLGRHLCFTRGDWENGLPALANASDLKLRALAEAELGASDNPSALIDAANRWWELADAQPDLARKQIRAHAATLYRKCLPAISGLHRSAAESRLASIEHDHLRDLNLQPGLFTHLFDGIAFRTLLKTRIDASIDFDWREAAPDPSLKKDNFSIRWTGSLHVRTPGQYTFTAFANTGLRLWIDDRSILISPDLTRSRNGASASLPLDPGLHAFRLEYWDTTGAANVRLLWKPPGSAKAEPIPTTIFWHDPADSP